MLVVACFVRRRARLALRRGLVDVRLIASLAWLVPWYVIWLLPLAALGTSVRLRRATLAFTAYLVLAFMPATGVILSQLNVQVMGSAVGQASKARQQLLEQ